MLAAHAVMVKSLISALVAFERHRSETAGIASVMAKMLWAQFINTAIVVLLIYANLISNSVLGTYGISVGALPVLNGDYEDTDLGWYKEVGVSLQLTMLINIVAQHGGFFFALLWYPCRRCTDRGTRCCDKHSSVSLSQGAYNKLFEGPTFDVALRYSAALNTVFVTLMYSAGLPLLLPMAFVSFFISYWIDKYALLRVCNMPHRYDAAVSVASVALMPIAAVIGCAFSGMRARTSADRRRQPSERSLRPAPPPPSPLSFPPFLPSTKSGCLAVPRSFDRPHCLTQSIVKSQQTAALTLQMNTRWPQISSWSMSSRTAQPQRIPWL